MSEPSDPSAKRMTCWQCPRYSRSEHRCRDGKANPKSKVDAIAVAEVLGLRALCHFNIYRDALALRMFFPADPRTVQASAHSRRPKGKRRLPPSDNQHTNGSASTSNPAAEKE